MRFGKHASRDYYGCSAQIQVLLCAPALHMVCGYAALGLPVSLQSSLGAERTPVCHTITCVHMLLASTAWASHIRWGEAAGPREEGHCSGMHEALALKQVSAM